MIWFLVFGGLLYAAVRLIGPEAPGSDQVIAVDAETLSSYLAAGGGEGGVAGPERFATLGVERKRALLRQYVEEQALYREAQAWGLEDGDIALRRRLGQTMRFALQPQEVPVPREDQLRAYFTKHAENYRRPGRVSFDHIYFSDTLRGVEGAAAAARAARPGDEGDWLAQGDRFAYQRSYADAGPGQVASQMGDGFAGALAKLPADGKWHGPIRSASGWHLVRVIARETTAMPAFAEARAEVADDWRRAQADRALDQAVASIVASYETTIDPGLAAQLR